MSSLQNRRLASQPYWLPRGALEHLDATAGVYYAQRRRRGSLAEYLAASGWTFARASEAACVAGGSLAFLPAHSIRIDEEPLTGKALGILLEGARTNLASWTQAFDNAYWNKTTQGTTISADATTAPDGTATADKILETTGNLWHAVYRSQTLTASVPYAISVYLKAGERSWAGPYHYDASTDRGSWFNLSTGAISTSGVGTKRNQALSNGWYRCIVTRTPSNAIGRFGVKVSNAQDAAGYVGVATSGVYGWGMQVEQAAFESSPIRETAGGSASRAADSLTRAIAQPSRLARVFRVRTAIGTAGNQTIWSVGDAADGVVLRRGSNGHIFLTVASGGATVADIDAGGVGTAAIHRVAVMLDGATARICLNAGDVLSAAAAIPTLTTLTERLGSSAVAGEEWFGHLQSATAYAALTDEHMRSLTAAGIYINALIGIDSLSDPPSTGMGRFLRDVMQSRIGVASAGWVPLIFASNTRVTGLNYTGGIEITRTTGYGGDNRTLDFQGRRWVTSDGSSISFFTPTEPYDQLDTVWLSQPGDGSCRFQSTGNGGAILDASTALGVHVQHVECFNAPNATVRWDQFSGAVSVVGVNFSRSGAPGFTYNPFGNGGYQVHQLAAIDDTSMRAIIAAIRPTHFLFNGGMNDRSYWDAVQFDADCRKILNNVRAAAPACKIIVIHALDPSDASTSYWNDYKPVKHQLALDYGAQELDLKAISASTASFSLANGAGLMQDGVHPTAACNRDVIAPWLADSVAW